MRMPLLTLLQQRAIVHPTTIVAGTFAAGDLSLIVEGHPWWTSSLSNETSRLRISFSGLSYGRLDPRDFGGDWETEALETFDVRQAETIDWLQPAEFHIFCSAPLPDPLTLHASLHDALVRAGSFKEATEFLNGGELLSRFRSITNNQSYNVARGPSLVRDTVCAELHRQGVPHNVVESSAGVEVGLLVTLGDSQFVCGDAWAEQA